MAIKRKKGVATAKVGLARGGRPRKPREVHEMNGVPGRRPLPPVDPATGELGNPPADLGDVEVGVWEQVRAECFWLKRADRQAVELLCRASLNMLMATRRVNGMLAIDEPTADDVRLADVAQRSLNRARPDCIRMLAELGATPATRARVVIAEPKVVNEEEQFFGGSR